MMTQQRVVPHQHRYLNQHWIGGVGAVTSLNSLSCIHLIQPTRRCNDRILYDIITLSPVLSLSLLRRHDILVVHMLQAGHATMEGVQRDKGEHTHRMPLLLHNDVEGYNV